jgi:Uma2 family endonuclease
MAAESSAHRMSVEAYLTLDRASTDTKYEYDNGYVVAMAGGTPQHSKIAAFAIAELTNALRDSPCGVFTSDVRVQVAATRYVYPDVTVSCDAEDQRADDMLRLPVVIIEVLSPGTERSDRGSKLHAYRACLSIQEYVLINTDRPLIEVYRRGGEVMSYYLYGPDDVLELTSLGIRIPVAEMYRGIEFPPDPEAV